MASPICPKCGSAMIRTTGRKGWRCNVAGNKFDWEKKAWSICDTTIWEEPLVDGFSVDAIKLWAAVKAAMVFLDNNDPAAARNTLAKVIKY